MCRIYKKTNSNKPGMDHEREDCFDSLVGSIPSSIQINSYNQSMTTTTTATNFSMYSELASLSLPMKRLLQPPSWEEEEYRLADNRSSRKRLQLMNGGGGGDNSIAALLSQLPSLQQPTLQGCIVGDEIFRPAFQLPETNWYS